MTTPLNLPLTDIFTAVAARATEQQAQEIANTCFGCVGTAKLLVGERDLNFHIRCQDGSQYLLKISNPAEDPAITDFQNRALLHIEQTDPALPVQRIHRSRSGEHQVTVDLNDQRVLVRLFSFVDGTPLNKVERVTSTLRIRLGESLARLGIALRGFFHPAAGHELLWDITHSSKLRHLVEHIPKARDRELVLHFIHNFEVHASPHLKQLRAQVIHNDFNFHNIIVDALQAQEIRNILDFGDIVHAPLINDLAVAASYQIGQGPDLLTPALELIGAYHRVSPLQEIEQAILFDLIAARLAVTAIITNWRASLYPENSAYILRNAPSAWDALRAFKQISRESAQAQIRGICSQEKVS